jgi:hypothetical protein
MGWVAILFGLDVSTFPIDHVGRRLANEDD